MKKKTITYPAKFKMSTWNFLNEVVENALHERMGILKIPLNVFRCYLIEISDRCAEINDPVLNMIMCNMALYGEADIENKDYNPKMVKQVEKDYKEYLKSKQDEIKK